ncbi:MAG: hypothetical protein HDR05_04315 [Lachnospiraceae bacterium]|nr:hypothetical protein [Lachnospiraceae bacterium]
MSRKNISDILNEKESINSQINRIEKLLSESSIDQNSLEDIMDFYCMWDWKARGSLLLQRMK